MIAEIARRAATEPADAGASMGPRSNDRGNGGPPLWPRSDSMLQWGRDQMIAEMLNWRARAVSLSLLQWGRDQMIAEIQSWCLWGAVIRCASMGPRSNDRGNKDVQDYRILAVEASMGPRSNDRGNECRSRAILRETWRFNGAAIK